MGRGGRRRERSRSPLRKTAQSERISRAICGFGRYPERRPPGLNVVDGSFRLRDLIQVWGRKHDFDEEDIIHAVRAHMFHDLHGGSLRFAVDSDNRGNVVIRVMPKRGSFAHCPQSDGIPVRERPRPPTSPFDSISQDPHRRPVAPLTTAMKIGMSLDEVIRSAPGGSGGSSSPFKPPEQPRDQPMREPQPVLATGESQAHEERAERVRRALEQMGLTAETKHLRLPPGSGRSLGSASTAATDDGAGEEAGRAVGDWICWALRTGHRKLEVPVDDNGWAQVDVLVAKMCADFGEFDAAKLLALLESTGQASRFEHAEGRIRRRRPQVIPMSPGASQTLEGVTRRSPSASPDASSRRRGPSPGSPVVSVEDGEGGEGGQCSPGARVTNPPPKPPGEHWTAYKDDQLIWYYYDGPKGSWWWSDSMEAPRPYQPPKEEGGAM